MDGRTFQGVGASKKLARNAAALEALKIKFDSAVQDVVVPVRAIENPTEHLFADFIAK